MGRACARIRSAAHEQKRLGSSHRLHLPASIINAPVQGSNRHARHCGCSGCVPAHQTSPRTAKMGTSWASPAPAPAAHTCWKCTVHSRALLSNTNLACDGLSGEGVVACHHSHTDASRAAPAGRHHRAHTHGRPQPYGDTSAPNEGQMGHQNAAPSAPMVQACPHSGVHTRGASWNVTRSLQTSIFESKKGVKKALGEGDQPTPPSPSPFKHPGSLVDGFQHSLTGWVHQAEQAHVHQALSGWAVVLLMV